MSLLIDATGENVSIADAASIRDLTAGTAIIWCRPTSSSVASRFFQKPNSGGGNGREFSRSDVGDNMLFFSERSTTTLHIEAALSNFANWALDAWMFVVLTWDESSAANCRLLVGSLSVLAAEPSSYTVQDTGSGTIVSDNTQAILVGNRLAGSGDRPFTNDIAHFSLYNRAMSVAEAQGQQFRRRPVDGCVAFHEFGYNGTGTQPDWSGNGNVGTVNGATVADHVPIPWRRRGAIYVPYAITVPDEAIWELDDLPVPASVDLVAIVDDVAGTPITKKATLANLFTLFQQDVVVQVKTVGSGTYTPTAGMKKVLGIAVGGGGGGHGGLNTDSAGGGGGGGGTVIRLMTAADIGASKAYVVGAGGGAGSAGAATTLDTAGALMNAGGGGAGTQGATFSVIGVSVAGGAGGTAANGDLNIPGQPGKRGIIFSGTDGKGGEGGRSKFGFGGAPGGTNVAGGNGQDYGGGGAGGHASATANRDGGAGADGILFLLEFL